MQTEHQAMSKLLYVPVLVTILVKHNELKKT